MNYRSMHLSENGEMLSEIYVCIFMYLLVCTEYCHDDNVKGFYIKSRRNKRGKYAQFWMGDSKDW
jgi:hypothetical protein